MPYKSIELKNLEINRGNDRHGELENETAAIAWLFNNKEQHMKNLAQDIVKENQIYEPPLVFQEGDNFTIFDGNRRMTCLKLLSDPKRAPNAELQEFFRSLSAKIDKNQLNPILCQVEKDRDKIDEILYRRHTGSQSGVGQSTWDDRMKMNFVNRSGKHNVISIADEVESALGEAGLLPQRRKIPRSTMNRLLSSEAFRNRVGISVVKKKFKFTHEQEKSLKALHRIALDLSSRKVVLGDLWDIDGKNSYLDSLEKEGLLPGPQDLKSAPSKPEKSTTISTEKIQQKQSPPKKRTTLIPNTEYNISWPGRLQRHREIWNELQHHLHFADHSNAISVLFRVLLELSSENYVNRIHLQIGQNEKLSSKLIKIAEHQKSQNIINEKYVREIKKFQHGDRVISADTLNRYVHSQDFAPSPEHLRAMWDTLAKLVTNCLKA